MIAAEAKQRQRKAGKEHGRSSPKLTAPGREPKRRSGEATEQAAKQSEDETLFQTAMRIKGRAIRRCGELLKAIEPAKGGQPFQAKSTKGGAPPSSRTDVAKAAGLSIDQTKQALRIASIPKREQAAKASLSTSAKSESAPTKTLGKEWAAKSDQWIADACEVTQPFVLGMRPQVVTVTTSSSESSEPAPERRTGKDGKSYPATKPRKPPAEPERTALAVVDK